MKFHRCRFPNCTGEATRWSRRGYCSAHVREPRRPKARPELIRPHEFFARKAPPALVFNHYGYAIVKTVPGGLVV